MRVDKVHDGVECGACGKAWGTAVNSSGELDRTGQRRCTACRIPSRQVQLVGLFIVTVTGDRGQRRGDDGNVLTSWVALGLFETGGLLLLVAVIAFGVRLGMRPPDEPKRREVSAEERALLARRAR